MRTMRKQERGSVLDLLEEAFGFRGIFLRYMDHDPLLRHEDTLLALDGEAPVSCVQIFSKRIRLRGETLELGGIGSVATALAYRKLGLASDLLSRALEEMERRGMALALLFTGLFRFYEQLGFVPVPQYRGKLHLPKNSSSSTGQAGMRAFAAHDLPAVRALYDAYTAPFDASTVRDEPYWTGQLAYAGNPEEDFRVVERADKVVAYARAIQMSGTTAIIEFARAPDAAAELAALLLAQAPTARPLVYPRAPDPELEAALVASGARVEAMPDPTLMWRVLDRARLVRLSGASDTQTERELLEALVGGPSTLYWPSDRF